MDEYSKNMLLVAAFMLVATVCLAFTFAATVSVSLPLATLSAFFAVGTASTMSLAIWCALTEDTDQ